MKEKDTLFNALVHGHIHPTDYERRVKSIEAIGKMVVGARVICHVDFEGVPTKNKKGTIVNADGGHSGKTVSVEFDSPIRDGHSCGGRAKEGHGWNIYREHLSIIETEEGELRG